MKLSGGVRTSSSQLEAPPNNIQHHSIPLIDSIFKGILKINSRVTWHAAAPKIISSLQTEESSIVLHIGVGSPLVHVFQQQSKSIL